MSVADWRILALDLKTGIPRRYLTPVAFTFEEVLNSVGNGSVTLGVRDVSLADVWPHATSVAFLRVNGEGASTTDPVCEFIGMVGAADPSSGGTLQVGLKSIEEYLNFRLIHGDQSYSAQPTDIAKALVELGSTSGIQLVASRMDSAFTIERDYLDTDQKKILEAIQELTQSENGPDYERIHAIRRDGSWGTTLAFRDHVGSTDPVSIYSTLGATEYSLGVDGDTHATRVIGVGSDPSLISDTGIPPESIYPLFERSEAWSDATDQDVLDQLTRGNLNSNRDPAAVPAITLAGLDLAPQLSLGDVLDLHLDHGAIQYHGDARLISKSWASGDSSPTTVVLTMVPISNTAEAILNQGS